MRLLLDECIDRRLAREMPFFEIRTVPQMGWAGIKNGELMKLAEAEFDVFVTVDRNLSYQQNLPKFDITLVVLRSVSNRLSDLLPFVDKLIDCVSATEPGTVTVLSLDDPAL